MNLFKQFLDLIPPRTLEVGTVQSIYSGIATIELPGGGVLQARGERLPRASACLCAMG